MGEGDDIYKPVVTQKKFDEVKAAWKVQLGAESGGRYDSEVNSNKGDRRDFYERLTSTNFKF